MQLISVEFHNFKLLENVRINFSTDPSLPLTIVRAENGSGKTSILWALLWGFYGPEGLPPGAKTLRLTSSAAPIGVPVEIQVVIEFARNDGNETTTYRLIRTVLETPRGGDEFERGKVKIRLLRRTPSGFKDVEGDPETVVSSFLPRRLKSVFFTDGDDVQRFISGETTHGRQTRVHEAIKALLGLDALQMAKNDLEKVVGRLRSENAKSAGASLEDAEKKLAGLAAEISSKDEHLDKLTERRSLIASQKASAEKEWEDLRGVGDIDELNAQIKNREGDLSRYEQIEDSILDNMKMAISSSAASWALAGEKLLPGYKILNDLADRGILPGTSIEVLTDRIELNACICGADLSEGKQARENVKQLREEQRKISESRSRQTETFHMARLGRNEYENQCEEGRDFRHNRRTLLAEYAQNRDSITKAGLELKNLKEKRGLIDEDRVQTLNDRIQNAENKLTETSEEIGGLESELFGLRERHGVAKDAYDKAEKASKIDSALRTQRLVADDLRTLIAETLAVMETDYVKQVSDRMNDMFMEIVGSNPTLAGAVFQSVCLTENFDIEVNTVGDGHLDPDFEVNGASQRALTLSFIWALMEVSGQVAPRIIDTPLGMTAGGVKCRMVEMITQAPTSETPSFQVILLLTRSEIRDIETLLEERAGAIQTLSCNKDFPADLVKDWEIDHPLVSVCCCTHRQFCNVCERKYDEEHGLVAREG